MSTLKVACVQMRSGVDIAKNVADASDMITAAARDGARLIATPEMTNLIDIRKGMGKSKAFREADSPALAALGALAKQHKVWLLIGSLAIAQEAGDKLLNRSYLIAPSGTVFARYDKMHMFDVEVGDGQSYRESAGYAAGTEAVLADTEIGKIGLSICYDLRFAGLYRALAQAGADILTCPAAFTKVTGEAHWHTLLRARAIETGAFVLAPAQTGQHEDGRQTFGHSLIVSPWGEMIAERSEDAPGILTATLDLSQVAQARNRIPSLRHDREISVRRITL